MHTRIRINEVGVPIYDQATTIQVAEGFEVSQEDFDRSLRLAVRSGRY